MINREQRKKNWEYQHRPESLKLLEKVVKYVGIALLIPVIVLSLLNPRNWIFVVAYLIISPIWKD